MEEIIIGSIASLVGVGGLTVVIRHRLHRKNAYTRNTRGRVPRSHPWPPIDKE